MSDDEETPVESAGEGDKSSTPSQSTLLVKLAGAMYRFGQSDTGEPFAEPKAGPRIALALRGSRRSLRATLAQQFFQLYGRAPSSSALADALAVLEGQAMQEEREPTWLRVAPDRNGLVVDLGDVDGRAVVVTPGRWRVTADSPVLFRRTELVGAMPQPLPGGRLDDLRDLLNVTEEAWPLLVGWLVASFLPTIPHPVLALSGEQGTGKSTAARMFVDLVDASPAPLRSGPKELGDWIVAASASWVVALDNLSSIPAWLSDALCRAVTGEGMVKRSLYTDGDVSVTAFRRCVMLTAIDAGAMRGDLAERLVAVELATIDPAQRLTDRELVEAWDRRRPYVLGALFDVLAEVLAVLPSIELEERPRMADFANVVAAVDRVLGTEALAFYLGQQTTLAEDVIDANPVADAIRQFAERMERWEGPAKTLLEALRADYPELKDAKQLPATPKGLQVALQRLAPALRRVGVQVSSDKHRTRDGRRWTIAHVPQGVPGERSQPSQRAQTASDLGKRGDGSPSSGDGCDGSPSRPSPRPSLASDAADLRKQAAGDGGDGCDGSIPTPSTTSANGAIA